VKNFHQHEALMILLLSIISIFSPLSGGPLTWVDRRLAPVAISFLCSCFLLANVWYGESFQFTVTWLTLPSSASLQVGLRVDKLSSTMATLVAFISGLVQIYSLGYFPSNERLTRFFSFMGLFATSMLVLVWSADLLLLSVGWSLVGLASYFLIGYYFEKPAASKAATQALLLNKLGDVFLLIGVIGTLAVQGNLFFAGNEQSITLWPHSAWWVPVCLILAAMVKSAQFPFHVWLPDAMEGPTPVSALLHAATMVVAGVFLLLRVYPLLPNELLQHLAYIGVFSALAASVIAFFQWDAKRMLAWSTIAQIGFMFAAIGFHAPALAFLHLFTHAVFKSGLFLSAGISIQRSKKMNIDPQHLNSLAGYESNSEKYAFVLFMSALIGFPLTIGFLSKEAILSVGLAHHSFLGAGLLLAGSLTSAYMGKYFFWFIMKKGKEEAQLVPVSQKIPVLVLAFLTLIPLGLGQYGIHTSSITFFTIGIETKQSISSPIWLPALAVALAIGGFLLGFYSQRKLKFQTDYSFKTPNWVIDSFFIQEFWNRSFRNCFIYLPSQVAYFDTWVLDRFLRAVGKSVVVLGHCVAFVDQKFVDNLIVLIAVFSKVGGRLVNSFQTAQMQRNLAHLFIFIIFFSWLVYWLFS